MASPAEHRSHSVNEKMRWAGDIYPFVFNLHIAKNQFLWQDRYTAFMLLS